MADTSYIIRNYRPADFDSYIALALEACKLGTNLVTVTAQTISEGMSWPGYSAENDLFVVEYEGRIIGYLNFRAELEIGRVIMDGFIHPEHRRKGLAKELLSHGMRRARELSAKVVHVNILEENKATRTVLTRLGFKYIKRFCELKLDMDNLDWEDADKNAADCRCLRPGEEGRLADIQNRSFAEHWGYNPNTLETIAYYTQQKSFSPENVILTCEGENVTGYCWVEIFTSGIPDNIREAEIHMIGTHPDHRGKGMGRKLLLAGLSYLKSKDVRIVRLIVDSENEVARALYNSVGFETHRYNLWYEKEVN